ncbi:MAG: Rrf2 family transcriptional regulator [Ruthenibacterium sp.]
MHITQETDYAVRIVYCLAKCGVRRDARSISEEMCISLRFSLKILGKLVTSGIVESYKGNRGGYELAKSAEEITLKDVINAVEGQYRLSRCVGEAAGECCNRGVSGCCTFQKIFSDISDEINVRLAGVNFKQVLEMETENK